VRLLFPVSRLSVCARFTDKRITQERKTHNAFFASGETFTVEICLITRHIYAMTPHQFAVAAGADFKWILNSAALLGRRVRYTASESRWWGLVRLLTESLGLPLKAAAGAATVSLATRTNEGSVTAGADPSHSASLLVDLERYSSIFLANHSRALLHETPRRRGRPAARAPGGAVASAVRYVVDLGLIQAALDRTPAQRLEMLESNARFVRDMRQRGK
jgi:hypothetical protein